MTLHILSNEVFLAKGAIFREVFFLTEVSLFSNASDTINKISFDNRTLTVSAHSVPAETTTHSRHSCNTTEFINAVHFLLHQYFFLFKSS